MQNPSEEQEGVSDEPLLDHSAEEQEVIANAEHLPVSWSRELQMLLRLSLPLVVNNVFSYIVGIVSIAFIGHLGPLALSSAVSIKGSGGATTAKSKSSS